LERRPNKFLILILVPVEIVFGRFRHFTSRSFMHRISVPGPLRTNPSRVQMLSVCRTLNLNLFFSVQKNHELVAAYSFRISTLPQSELFEISNTLCATKSNIPFPHTVHLDSAHAIPRGSTWRGGRGVAASHDLPAVDGLLAETLALIAEASDVAALDAALAHAWHGTPPAA